MKLFKLLEKYRNISAPVKASIWYTFSSVLIKGIALLSTPVFTRILSEEQYGAYSIFQSWFNILIIFTSLNMFSSSYTKGLILFKDDQAKFTSSVLGLSTLITCIWGIIYLANTNFWGDIFDLEPHLMFAMFVELLTMPAIEYWAAKERFEYKYKKYVIVSVFTVVISIGLGIPSILLTEHKVEARVYSDVLAKALFGVTLFILLFCKGKTVFNKKYWKYSLGFNLPLIPHYLSTYILNQSDRIMIGKIIGTRQAAYYSVAYTISTMMNLITTAINNSLIPYIYKSIDANEKENIPKVTNVLFMFVALLSILTMAFAPEIIVIFAGENYSSAIYVVPPIAASVFFIFLYAMFSTIEYYYQKTGLIAVATCMSALLNVLLNYIFILKFGYYAAGYTTLVCYMCLAILHYVFYRRVIKIEMDNCNLYDVRVILGLSLGVVAVMFIMIMTYRWIIVRYVIIMSIVCLTFFYRKKIIVTFKKMKL